MYYIQTFNAVDILKNRDTDRSPALLPWLKTNYMGAAEFEWGTIPMAWRFLKIREDVQMFSHEVQSKGGRAEKVTFLVITTPEGFEYFKQKIDRHMDGTQRGDISKRYTALWEKFNSDSHFGQMPDAWMSIGGMMNAALNKYSDQNLRDLGKEKWRTPNDEAEPIFFTADIKLARRVYLSLKRDRMEFNHEDFRIADQVLSYLSIEPMKVCGLNEDNTISCKFRHGKVRHFLAEDVFPYDQAIKFLQK